MSSRAIYLTLQVGIATGSLALVAYLFWAEQFAAIQRLGSLMVAFGTLSVFYLARTRAKLAVAVERRHVRKLQNELDATRVYAVALVEQQDSDALAGAKEKMEAAATAFDEAFSGDENVVTRVQRRLRVTETTVTFYLLTGGTLIWGYRDVVSRWLHEALAL